MHWSLSFTRRLVKKTQTTSFPLQKIQKMQEVVYDGDKDIAQYPVTEPRHPFLV
jgi:hypothetical protein